MTLTGVAVATFMGTAASRDMYRMDLTFAQTLFDSMLALASWMILGLAVVHRAGTGAIFG